MHQMTLRVVGSSQSVTVNHCHVFSLTTFCCYLRVCRWALVNASSTVSSPSWKLMAWRSFACSWSCYVVDLFT